MFFQYKYTIAPARQSIARASPAAKARIGGLVASKFSMYCMGGVLVL